MIYGSVYGASRCLFVGTNERGQQWFHEEDEVVVTGVYDGVRVDNFHGMIATISDKDPDEPDDVAAIKLWPSRAADKEISSGKVWFPLQTIEGIRHQTDVECEANYPGRGIDWEARPAEARRFETVWQAWRVGRLARANGPLWPMKGEIDFTAEDLVTEAGCWELIIQHAVDNRGGELLRLFMPAVRRIGRKNEFRLTGKAHPADQPMAWLDAKAEGEKLLKSVENET